MGIMNTEAVSVVEAIKVAAIAFVGVAAVMLGWDPEFETLVIAAVAAVIMAVGAWIQRSNVWSQASHEEVVDEALHTPVPLD